jgi:hypothetical protein
MAEDDICETRFAIQTTPRLTAPASDRGAWCRLLSEILTALASDNHLLACIGVVRFQYYQLRILIINRGSSARSLHVWVFQEMLRQVSLCEIRTLWCGDSRCVTRDMPQSLQRSVLRPHVLGKIRRPDSPFPSRVYGGVSLKIR